MPLSLAYEVEIPGVDVAAYDAAWASDPTITVNGEKRRVDASKVTGSTTLLDFLRLECGLTGAKLGCGEGGCGACTVVVSTWDVSARKPVHRSINGCLAPALSCVGAAVTTVEGMGSAAAPHPIQSALAEGHGSQCGFCTPGIAASMYALITPETTVADVEEHLDGNLCRCTGYRPIWDAAKQLCVDAKDAAATSQRQGTVPALERGHRCDTSRKCANAERPALPEIPFPPALATPLGAFRCGDFWRPGTVGDACALKKHFGSARFYISLSGVPALVGVAADTDCLVVGGAAPLNDVVAACHLHEAEERTAAGPLRAAAQLLRWFASTQIRNGASLGGNLATASPISDMNPLLAACRATFVRPYKQSRRREDDIAIVTSTLRVVLAERDGGYVVQEAAFAFGGLAATVKLADATAKCVVGRRFDMDLYDTAARVLGDEVRLGASAPGGQPEYRAALACSFLFKFFLATARRRRRRRPRSAGARTFVDAPKPSITGAQAWPVLDRAARGLEATTYDTLHRGGGPLVCGVSKKHQTALLQVTGEARYTDDQPAPAETLHACLVLAGKVGAIRGVDMVKARVMPGVVGVFSAADLPKCAGANDLGAIVHDEECFATEFAPYPGQVVAIAVAKTYVQAAARAAKLYSNGGASLDLSGPVLDRALLHVDNVYAWTRLRARGVVCKTALPPSTAFRGFGGPQGMVVTEHVVEHLAHALGHGDHGDALRAANTYGEGDVTHYAQPIASCAWRVPRCVARVKETSGYDDRVAAVAAFNDAHAHRKRSLALVPTKFGINFTAKLLNQGGSLVHLYTDGTLLVSHGGTEMGQGLHTVCQVARRRSGVAIDRVHVEDTASDKVANSAATAASMSTDLYGMAALDACHQILARLRPVYDRRRAAGDSLELAAVAGDAFFNRIDLSAHGFYAVDGARCGYDWDRPNGDRGMPFNYWTQGAAVAEVELDCLTGDFEVRRADVLVDLGCSINPALDVGQIEGAFVQGAGWLTTEELIVSEAGHGEDANHAWFGAPPGTLLTNGPGNYKLPSFNDAPRDFRVELLDRADNVHCVHSSKAVGEPPFFLGASVLFALQHAVQARRADRGVPGYLGLRAPATPGKLRMHCRDAIADAAVARLGRDPATWHASASC
ncbi:xanthine dehydrogenase [Aureococcus anophagefferens]|nr:xanthine dehydrogenase [Aureococcus anophagefferens]